MRRTIALLAAAAGCLALTASASADSIAYIKGHDVWKATPDGKRHVQLTKGGGYHAVSQADDGTMIALTGRETLVKLSPTGRRLTEFQTYVSDGNKVGVGVDKFAGPFDPQISPDGSKVAFEWYNDTYGASAGCNESSFPPCYTYRSTKGVGITYSDRLTDPREFGLLTGWSYPQWIDDATLMRSYAGVAMNEDAVFQTLQPGMDNNRGELIRRWFHDPDGRDLVDMQLSADRTKVVGVGGDSDELLRIYRVLEDPLSKDGATVMACAQWTNPVGRFADPTFSPDGRRLVWAEEDGIRIADAPDLSVGCALGSESRMLIPGGSSPDFGPADVPAVRKPAKPKKPRRGRAA